ncbi:MAG: amino acid permease [Ignavibacteriales bacterium]|nr:amino acid permease [Ignavibacteriales bacterium]
MTKPTHEFQRRLTLFDSTSIVIGSMIGSGIFIVSADIARTVQSPGWMLVCWILTGVITIMAALSYGELASMMPHAGGQYVYLREAFGPLPAFLYGWTLFLVIQTGTIAAVAVAFSRFTGVLVPWFSDKNSLLTLGPISFSTQQLLAIVCIWGLTLMNLRGIVAGKIVQNFFTTAKVAAFGGLIVLGLFLFRNPSTVSLNFDSLWDQPLSGIALAAALGSAMVGSLFSADAWNNITFAGAEVKNPNRNIALSMALGTIAVVAVYLLTNMVYLSVLPFHGDASAATAVGRGIQFAASDRIGTAAAEAMLGGTGSAIMAVFIMISTFGCNNGLILAGARVSYAMAKDGLFFQSTGTLSGRGVPARALLTQAVWASLLCVSGSYSNLLDYVVFAVLIFYILTIAGLFKLRKSRPDLPRPYRAVGYPYVPAAYVLLASLICIDLLFMKPNYTWPGLIIVLLGLPVYWFWRRNNEQPPSPLI